MKAEPIQYSIGALTAEGALVYEEKISGRRPAVLVAPNRMGMTEKPIERAKLVAGDRYVVLVADMYGQGARPADFGAALQTLIAEGGKRDLIDARRAAIGFCFGGGNVLELARDGADIAAAVSIHGDLKTAAPTEKSAIKAKLLVARGAPDPVVPKADRDAFEAEMGAAGAQWQMLVFSGLYHAYTDQGFDVPGVAAWDEPASRQTYALTHQFIADAFDNRL